MADTTDRSKSREIVNADNDESMASDACNIDSSDDPIYVKTEQGCSGDRLADHLGNMQGFELSVTSSAGSSNHDNHLSSVTSTDLSKSLVVLTDNKWSSPATGLLLDLYKQNEDRFNNPHIKKKLLWREISEKLNNEGFMFDPDKCERKFLNLKTTYRYTVDHNVQTGNQKRCAFYEQLHSIFRFQLTRDSLCMGKSNQGDQSMDDTVNRPVVPVSLTVCDRAGSRPENMSAVPHSGAGSENTFIGPNVNFISGTNTLVVSMDDGSSSKTSSHRTPSQTGSRNPVPGMFADVNSMHHTANRNPYPSPQQTTFSHAHGSQQQNVPRRSNLNFSGDRRMSSYSQECYVPRHTEDEDSSRELPSSSCVDRNDESEFSGQQRGRKRKNSELDNLLATFEKYREEQRQREEQRMKCMKEWHDEEMKVMNRFLDIIQQSMQSGNNN